MAKIKLTKTELKSQQDALKQYRRFLPTLQLKKQQLQMEIRNTNRLLEENKEALSEAYRLLSSSVAVFAEPELHRTLGESVKIRQIVTRTTNIAGVSVPVFEKLEFEPIRWDGFQTPYYYFDANTELQALLALRIKEKVIAEQHRLLSRELLTTTQRVNLFEKVKIPECQENIRTIRIYLSDMDTAAVARGKIAKRKVGEEALAS
ncbi:MAG: V-type ATP synthase subunit D [Victivallaceae bacterium]|nr:V-type ATP synthase subunit D [Victivallaceae bacterium]